RSAFRRRDASRRAEAMSQSDRRREVRCHAAPPLDCSRRGPRDLRAARVEAAAPAGRLGRRNPDGVVHPEPLGVLLHKRMLAEFLALAEHLTRRRARAIGERELSNIEGHLPVYDGIELRQALWNAHEPRLKDVGGPPELLPEFKGCHAEALVEM